MACTFYWTCCWHDVDTCWWWTKDDQQGRRDYYYYHNDACFNSSEPAAQQKWCGSVEKMSSSGSSRSSSLFWHTLPWYSLPICWQTCHLWTPDFKHQCNQHTLAIFKSRSSKREISSLLTKNRYSHSPSFFLLTKIRKKGIPSLHLGTKHVSLQLLQKKQRDFSNMFFAPIISHNHGLISWNEAGVRYGAFNWQRVYWIYLLMNQQKNHASKNLTKSPSLKSKSCFTLLQVHLC